MKNRPHVLSAFFKNGHNYKKDYGLKVESLGKETMCWWEEIKTTDGATNVRFGGPTGIYVLVVLMSWWCSLLKDQPDDKLTDCLRTLEDIDCVILSALRGTNDQSPIGPSPGGSSPEESATLPTHRTRDSK